MLLSLSLQIWPAALDSCVSQYVHVFLTPNQAAVLLDYFLFGLELFYEYSNKVTQRSLEKVNIGTNIFLYLF